MISLGLVLALVAILEVIMAFADADQPEPRRVKFLDARLVGGVWTVMYGRCL